MSPGRRACASCLFTPYNGKTGTVRLSRFRRPVTCMMFSASESRDTTSHHQSRGGEKNGNSTTIVLNLIRSTVLQYLNLHRDLPIFPANTCTSPSLQVRDGRVTRIAWFHGDGEQDSDPRPTRRSTAGVN
jgi:hypothetical protein